MKILFAVIASLVLAGCATGMTPEQLKASSGMATCTTVTTVYGKTSFVTADTADVRKGTTAAGKTTITCGDASMAIDTNVGVAGPVMTTTTVTTTPLKPATP
ncbi:MAG: hypothetical protein NUV34_03115 [Sulfuricaulis sp.]|nr:hypothetical protein [Sulfuricaulis sp.]